MVTTLSAFSQTKNITVSGRVVEDTREPAIQATVQLLLLPDSVQASGTATTAQRFIFTLPKVSAGKYVLKVSYIGFKSQYIPLHLYATTTAKNVGTLTLETDAVMLAEAVVTAEAPQGAGGGRYTGCIRSGIIREVSVSAPLTTTFSIGRIFILLPSVPESYHSRFPYLPHRS